MNPDSGCARANTVHLSVLVGAGGGGYFDSGLVDTKDQLNSVPQNQII